MALLQDAVRVRRCSVHAGIESVLMHMGMKVMLGQVYDAVETDFH